MSQSESPKNNKKLLIGLPVLVAIAVLFGVVYTLFAPKAAAGAKELSIEVVDDTASSQTYTVHTDAQYLRQALEEQKLVSGSESEYGLWVQTVDGETANEANQEWWGYDINGVQAEYGVDSQPIADGDVILFTLHVGW